MDIQIQSEDRLPLELNKMSLFSRAAAEIQYGRELMPGDKLSDFFLYFFERWFNGPFVQ